MSTTTDNSVQTESGPTRIKISEVLALLDQGKSRKEIAEYFGKTQVEMAREVWSHPKLKGKKAKKQYSDSIVLEDDYEESLTSQEDTREDAPEAEAVTETVSEEETQTSSEEESQEEPATEGSSW